MSENRRGNEGKRENFQCFETNEMVKIKLKTTIVKDISKIYLFFLNLYKSSLSYISSNKSIRKFSTFFNSRIFLTDMRQYKTIFQIVFQSFNL